MAHARAGAILADADAQAAARRRRFFSEHEPTLRARMMRRIALVRRDCTTAVLTARQAVLERIFATTAELLGTREALDDYARGSRARLEAALAYLGDRPAIVRCPPSIADSVRPLVDSRPGLALESDPAMAAEAEALLAAHGVDNAVVQAGPLEEGVAEHGPFDAILVEGAIETLPHKIEAQLKVGGRIAAIFAEGAGGQARLGLRTPQGIAWRRIFDATAPVLPGFAATKAFVF